ncbi:CRISPR-associated RAMP protein, family [Anoxybacillus thermarum]|uniref:CRISPR-associated RAMP protein, family n=1 Tax=Anoxybacillus thermarum TaxID=404937 RepID=A0A0D0QYK0_9BACL|nr:CRISPR-associated RAMP protein Csx7 [Anoxybacillus thermarum]KIQ94509.1 CRISPR-associated RAMP protein, family [Anoxybacillus thermarum]
MVSPSFVRLEKKQVFTIHLRLKTPLHIGGGYDSNTDTDLPIVRTREGFPYIPGSSIKGMLRSASEKLYHIIDDTKVCFLEKNDSCTIKLKQIIADTLEKHSEEEAFQKIYQRICPICRTYGMGAIASKVYVPNVVLQDKTMVRDGIQIDREMNVVSGKAKFDYEYVEAGQTFTMRIEAENMTKENEKVLGVALLQLSKNYIRLGGLQARGLGELEYISGHVTIVDFSSNNHEKVLNMLLGEENDLENISLECYLNDLFRGAEKNATS